MILKRIIERLGGYTIKTRLVMAFIALISIPMLISTLIVSNLITKSSPASPIKGSSSQQ